LTYWWEFLVRKLRVADIIDLRVKEWHDFFWAHRVHLVFKVGNHVEVLTAGWVLNDW